MRIALVAPPWEIMVNSYPPLGLGYVAASLRREHHEVKIFDFGLNPKAKVNEIVDIVLNYWPDFIGITTWTHLFHVCAEIADQFKVRANIPIVLGGPHASVFPVETLEDEPSPDFTIFGEGEDTIVELLEAYKGLRSYDSVQGLAFRSDRKIIKNPVRQLSKDIDRYPCPDRKLLEITKYPLHAHNGEKMTTMMTTRGCPYACTYCFKGLFGRRYLMTGNDLVIEEIKQVIRDFSITYFYFVDDLFVVRRDRLYEFIEKLKQENLDIRWQCLARVDRLQAEDYQAMAKAGCFEVHFGIETADPMIMENIDKQTTPDRVKEAVRWAYDAGIRAKGYFMIGLPGDTEETIMNTINFACDLPLANAMFSLTTPFPGTKLWEQIKDRFVGIPRRELFKRASYYYGSQDLNEPMFNFTELPTAKLIEFVKLANAIFQKRKSKRRMEEYLGKTLGSVAWKISGSKVGRALKPIKPGAVKVLEYVRKRPDELPREKLLDRI